MSLSFKINGVAVTVSNGVCSYTSGMVIDFDGCPDAYAPHGFGSPRDALANAGHDGNWWGIITDTGKKDGTPVIQGPNDPFPGYFVASSALNDGNFSVTDPRRYFDGSKLVGISIPKTLLHVGVKIGDLAIVERNSVVACAIVFDDGGQGIGEGSPALADALGIPSDRHGGCNSGVSYRIFLGSRTMPAWPRTADEMQAAIVLLAGA